MQRPISFAEYDREFQAERLMRYPEVEEFERHCGAAIDNDMLEQAARVLACPVKQHPACWQHGRVVYAAAMKRLRTSLIKGPTVFLDVGTAKGFSALCMQWAIEAWSEGFPSNIVVVSLDVIDPYEGVRRNTVSEVASPGMDMQAADFGIGPRWLTLEETLMPWDSFARRIYFQQSTGIDWLKRNSDRVPFAFLDGKHTYEHVTAELTHLARVQQGGDIVVLDDVHVPGVAQAIAEHENEYAIASIVAKPVNEEPDRVHAPRAYAVATKRSRP